MQNVAATLFVLVLAAVFLTLLERRFHAHPPARVFARARLVDLAHWVIGARLSNLAAGAVFAVAMVAALPSFVIARLGLVEPGHLGDFVTPFMRLPVALQFPLALLLSDFLGYWSHRLHHQAPLWRFHAIHHSPRELDWMAGARNHPVAEAAARVCVGIPLILLGVDFRVLAAMIPFVGLWAVFLHANVRWRFGPLRWVIATPHFHRWHHSRAPEARGKNFAALFPLWDLLFGTLFLPDRLPDHFGLDEAQNVPSGFVGQTLYPFRRAASPRPGRSL